MTKKCFLTYTCAAGSTSPTQNPVLIRPSNRRIKLSADAIHAHDIVQSGEANNIVFRRPIFCIRGPDTRLPINAPTGGIDPLKTI